LVSLPPHGSPGAPAPPPARGAPFLVTSRVPAALRLRAREQIRSCPSARPQANQPAALSRAWPVGILGDENISRLPTTSGIFVTEPITQRISFAEHSARCCEVGRLAWLLPRGCLSRLSHSRPSGTVHIQRLGSQRVGTAACVAPACLSPKPCMFVCCAAGRWCKAACMEQAVQVPRRGKPAAAPACGSP
jgi:hypothetical protein